MKQTCILVLGMHRSGTSALTGVLSLLDVYLADTTKGDVNNPKGYFENWKVQQLNDKIFSSINSSWHDEFFNLNKIENIAFEVSALTDILKSNFEYSAKFAIKDPRVCFLFPLWEAALKRLKIDIKIILPYRNPIEVANSLNKRDGMSLEKGMLLWAYHFLLAEKFSRGYDRVFVGFDELIANTNATIKMISSALSVDFQEKYTKNKKEIDAFLEPSLKHHNISMDNLSNNVPKIVKDILALKEKLNDADLSKEFDVLRKELFGYQKLFYNASIVSSLDEGQRAKHALHVKTQEAEETKHALHVKTQEAEETKHALHVKTQEAEETKHALHVKTQEAEMLKEELTRIYVSKSWKLTRPLRQIMRKVNQ